MNSDDRVPGRCPVGMPRVKRITVGWQNGGFLVVGACWWLEFQSDDLMMKVMKVM